MTPHCRVGAMLLACSTVALFAADRLTPAAAAGFQTDAQARAPYHTLIGIDGNVSLKRTGWRDYVPAAFGAPLRRGDLLRVNGGGRAQVVCADLTLQEVRTGISGVPCPEDAPLLTYRGSLIAATRASSGDGYPVLIAPRQTKLLGVHPVIRWLLPRAATSATVTVTGSGLNWSTTIQGASVTYPRDAPALLRGRTYRVAIVSSSRSSDEEGQPGTGFTIASEDDARRMERRVEAVRGLRLPRTANALLVARLYDAEGFIAEAIETLEAVSPGAAEPALMRDLGGLYLAAGLTRLAAERYVRGLDMARAANDIEGQAELAYALGVLHEDVFGNRQSATSELQQAMKLFERLGDQAAVKRIGQRIAGM